jgi:hypothetical protein
MKKSFLQYYAEVAMTKYINSQNKAERRAG